VSDQLTKDLASLQIDRTAPKGTSLWTRLIVFAVVAAVLGGAAYYAYPHLEARVFKTEVAFTTVVRVSPSQASTSFTSTGYVVPQRSSRVAARVPGRIARVLVAEGEAVTEGQVLAELDTDEPRSALLAARSQTAAAEARVETARAAVMELELQTRRTRPLVEGGAVARSTLEDLDARLGSARAALRAAEAEVRAAHAESQVAQVGLGQTTVVAPMAGTVTTEPQEVGEIAGPNVELLQIVDFSSLVVEIDVPEARLGLVRADGPCEIVLDAFPGQRFRGEVLEVGRQVNRAKATVPVKVRFADAAEGVLPDMSARVSFLTEALSAEQLQAAAKTIVPRNAVVTRGGRQVVFVVEDDVVRELPVQLGPESGEGFELVVGPEPGTRLVADPPETLQTGQSVKEQGS
jgi:RND family efflux transporter MFP subunit